MEEAKNAQKESRLNLKERILNKQIRRPSPALIKEPTLEKWFRDLIAEMLAVAALAGPRLAGKRERGRRREGKKKRRSGMVEGVEDYSVLSRER